MTDSVPFTLELFADAERFWEVAGELLVSHEAENCLMIGICNWVRDPRPPLTEPPYLAVVYGRHGPVGALVRTPRRPLVLSFGLPEAAVDLVVEHVAETFPDLSAVLGPKPGADLFVQRWKQRSRVEATLFRNERIYRAESVEPPLGVAGEARPVTSEDRDVFEQWLAAFGIEVGEEPEPDRIKEIADVYMSGPPFQAFLWWVDDRPVSMAGLGGPTPNGARINAVYTPAEFRGRGYASAVTAALTRYAFEQGRRLCFLFTDVANPTSNRIYQRIGYRPVCDVSHYRFDE